MSKVCFKYCRYELALNLDSFIEELYKRFISLEPKIIILITQYPLFFVPQCFKPSNTFCIMCFVLLRRFETIIYYCIFFPLYLYVNCFQSLLYKISAKERFPIKVTLPDGKEVEGKAWQTTPYEIAASIRYLFNYESFFISFKLVELRLN